MLDEYTFSYSLILFLVVRGQLVLVCLILNRGRGGAVGCTWSIVGRFLGVPLVASFLFSRAVFSAREHLCISELLISLCFGCDAYTYPR